MVAEPDNIRRRSACDRCHSQKLRCPRRLGVDVCDRCCKARASCVYSPFRQKTIAKDPPEPQALPQQRHERHNPYSRDSLGDLSVKRKRTNPPSLSHHGLTTPVQHDPLIVDTIGLGLDWPSNTYSSFGDLDLDTSFDGFNFDTIHGTHPLSTLYTTSDSSGVSDTPSPASYEASDGLPAMPFTFEPLQAFQLESPTSSIQAFENINFTPQVDQEHPLGRYMATSPKSWENSSMDIQPGSIQKSVRQLSELSISLYEHSTTLPSQYVSDPMLGQENKTTTRRASCYGEFNLDETFQLTQNLIDIYPTFIDSLKKRQSNVTSPFKAQSSPDQSSILLILSCHMRLIEIYEELFPHMEVCIAQKGKSYSPQQQNIDKAPFSRFGGYQPPSSSTVSMQMMMLVQLAKKLLDCAAELFKVTQSLRDLEPKDDTAAARTGMSTGSLDVSVMTAENVKSRASNMAQQLGTLRDLMLQMGIFA